jgi:hypothetical protein
MSQTHAPNACLECMSRTHVPHACPECTSRTHVSNECPENMSHIHVPFLPPLFPRGVVKCLSQVHVHKCMSQMHVSNAQRARWERQTTCMVQLSE